MDRDTRGRRRTRHVLAMLAIAVTTLMTFGSPPSHATTPGKNGRIAFAMDKGSGAQIYSIKRDGTGLRKLTSVSADALTPDWSPNGHRILFADDVNAGTASNLAIMHSDGSHFRALTYTGYRESPDFIPGGRHIATAATAGRPMACSSAVSTLRKVAASRRARSGTRGTPARPSRLRDRP